MTPAFVQVDATTEIAGPPNTVFAHWMDPQARQRYEASPESGMRYKNFTAEQGGIEEVEIIQDGNVIGLMRQHLLVLDAPRILVSHIAGTFHGATTMGMQITMRFEAVSAGTAIHATSQVVDLTGRDVRAEHQAGWMHLYEKFARDFKEYGPNS